VSGARIGISPLKLLLYVAAAVLCAVPAVFINSIYGYCALLFFLFLSLISLTYAISLSRGVRNLGSLKSEMSCSRGNAVELNFRVRNNSRLICPRCRAVIYTTDLFGELRSKEDIDFALASREERTFSLSVRFDHIGKYRVGIRKITVEGLLGVLSFALPAGEAEELSVTPRIHAMGGLRFLDRARSESNRANLVSSAESIDCSGVREYAFGDPIKLIHWKLSSHIGGYVTKVLESYGNNGLTVLPCLTSPDYDTETLMTVYDCIVEVCASLCICARENGMDAELLYCDKDGESRRDNISTAEDFLSINDTLPPINTDISPLRQSYDLLSTEAASRYANANIALCTALLDEEILQGLLRIFNSGKNPLLFYIRPLPADTRDRQADKALRTLDNWGVTCCVISVPDDIERAVSP